MRRLRKITFSHTFLLMTPLPIGFRVFTTQRLTADLPAGRLPSSPAVTGRSEVRAKLAKVEARFIALPSVLGCCLARKGISLAEPSVNSLESSSSESSSSSSGFSLSGTSAIGRLSASSNRLSPMTLSPGTFMGRKGRAIKLLLP